MSGLTGAFANYRGSVIRTALLSPRVCTDVESTQSLPLFAEGLLASLPLFSPYLHLIFVHNLCRAADKDSLLSNPRWFPITRRGAIPVCDLGSEARPGLTGRCPHPFLLLPSLPLPAGGLC